MWNNITNSLLQKKHIKIPIEKRFFLSFIEDDENNIQKNKIIEVLNKYGLVIQEGIYENGKKK